MEKRLIAQMAALGASLEGAALAGNELSAVLATYPAPEPRQNPHEQKKYRAHARKGKPFDGTRAKVKAARKQNRKRK